jgi:glycerophosphoryl diester phosphodiesterase
MRLGELLDGAPLELPVQVEVKAHGNPKLARATAAEVCRAVRAATTRRTVEVLSFHTCACEEAAAEGLPARLIIWADYAIGALVDWAVDAGVGGVCVEHFLLHAELVQRLRASGLSVSTGTINDPTLALQAALLEIDAITTDRPDALRRELIETALAA